jgi:hypothetical protein
MESLKNNHHRIIIFDQEVFFDVKDFDEPIKKQTKVLHSFHLSFD